MKVIKALCLLLIISPATAQEVDVFLECAQFSDRVERAFCLENALDQAVDQQNENQEADQDNVVSVESFGSAADTEVEEAQDLVDDEQGANTEARQGSRFKLPVIGNLFRRNAEESDENESERELVENLDSDDTGSVDNFGRQTASARVETNATGSQELHDVISALEEVRPSQWEITLASGQVWQQMHVKRLNLRENDKVRIYPSKWGKNYRLEAEGLSGFIQVLRVE